MSKSSERRSLPETESHEADGGALEWQAPTVTLLGDAQTLTLGAGGSTIDGPFNTPGT